MKIGRLLFKPKWQDKDPGVRAVAVASDDDPGLQAALPELTRSDPDARVRLAALKRIDDYERWRERSTGDDDAGVRRSARSAYLSLLCSDDSRVPPLARRIAELETLSVTEIEAVASSARDRGLRAAPRTRMPRNAPSPIRIPSCGAPRSNASAMSERSSALPNARARPTS